MGYINLNKKRSPKFLQKYKKLLFIAGSLIFLSLTIAFFNGPGEVFQYIFQGGLGLKNDDGKVNVLLLGNAGSIHDGPYLTDTVMVASLDLKGKRINLISLPRDLWLDKYKLKLNAVYVSGEDRGGGLKFARVTVGEILGVPVHYGIRMDFRGFIQAVDQLGGLDVMVERSFVDSLYPIEGQENDLCGFKEEERDFSEEEAKSLGLEPGKRKILIAPDGKIATDSADPEKGLKYFSCRFERIQFTSGLTHTDGATALKFVRSRMGTNNEGSDFARSKRQQKVLEAFREKVISLETLVKPAQVSELLQTFGESVEVDIPIDDGILLYSNLKKVTQVNSFMVDGQKEGSLLVNPPLQDFGGAWVLLPRVGNYSEIHRFVKNILAGRADESSTAARTSDR